MARFPLVDQEALAAQAGVDLPAALEGLAKIYDDLDERNRLHTAGLDLPCHQGCSACCEEAVFLSPIEFFAAWDHAQRHLSDDERDEVVTRALKIYHQQREEIDALSGPLPEGEADHTKAAVQIRFRCPLLDDQGQCRVYGAREVYARLFGSSFNEERGVYGCDLVGAHLADKVVTLVRAKPAAEQVLALPLSRLQQLYPWYFFWIYGGIEPAPSVRKSGSLPVVD